MTAIKTISKAEFRSRFKATGVRRSAIFSDRKALMETIHATGAPIYCDQSYYAQCESLDLVEKQNGNFTCGIYDNFEEWRDCHYYSEFAEAQGQKAWLMTGGRYD